MGKFVLKRVLFSGDENKIKTYDKLRIATGKLSTRGTRENYRDIYEEAAKNGKVSDETMKKAARRDSLGMVAGGALGGTLAGGYVTSKMKDYKHLKGKYRAAAIAGGAIAGLGMGTAAGAVLGAGNYLSETTLGKATINKFAKDKKNREKYQKDADILKVSLGEMSKGEFAKRWGEKKFSSKPQKDWDAEDEDYVDDVKRRYNEERKMSSWGNPLAGGLGGAYIGLASGSFKNARRNGLIGAAIGTGIGAAIHHGFVKPHTKDLEESEIKKYMNIKDKEGRRRKIDRDTANKARVDAGRYAGGYGARGGIYGGW